MKLIHMADVHLGVRPDKGKPWAEVRKKHNWEAFTQVITTAEQEQTDLLLIAGDLFHGQPLLRELKEVNYQFSRLTHTQVVLIAGNHDYITPDSYYRTFSWEEHVHFLRQEKIEYVEIPALRTRVYGLSYWHRELPGSLYENLKIAEGDFINILMVHGGDEKHIPFQPKKLLQAGFDYVACGHIHKPVQLVEHKVIMAGALQPIDCSDVGAHGFFQGELSKGRCQMKFRPLEYCEYVPLHLKVTREVTTGALTEFVKRKISQAKKHQIFKIILNGFCDGSAPLETEPLEELDRVVQVVNQCCPDYDFERLKMQYAQQLIGKYIKAIEEMPRNEVSTLALYYGVEALLEE